MSYLLYDGNCQFCLNMSNKLSSLTKKSNIFFLPFSSLEAKELISKYEIKNLDSVIYIDNQERIFLRANAFFSICKFMKFPYNLLFVFNLLPNSFLNSVYNFIAKNRHKI